MNTSNKQVEEDDARKLTVAVYQGDVRTVQELLDKGVDPSGDGSIPLILPLEALRNRKFEVFELLIKAGANVSRVSKMNHTLLVYLTENESEALSENYVRLLLDNDADPNYRVGDSALMCASRRGHLKVMKMLLEAGAEVNALSEEDTTALDKALQNRRYDAADLLIESGGELGPNNAVEFDLVIASTRASLAVVRVILNSSKILITTNLFNETPLVCAVRENRRDVVKELLRAGGSVKEKDLQGNQTLTVAAKHNCIQVMPVLIAAGAEVEERNKEGRTPLLEATKAGRKEAVAYLIGIGADKTVVDNKGETALSLAAVRLDVNREVISTLKKNGFKTKP